MRNMGLPVLLWLCVLMGADTPTSAVKKVREGVLHFQNSKWEDADSAFTEAKKLAPENSVVVFDRACARRAKGAVDDARSDFQSAALAKDPATAVKSYYNLGCLESSEAKRVLGDKPEEVTGEAREQSIQLLLTSIRHYHSALRIDGDHRESRHNLELTRLYIKHIQAKWAEFDRQKERDQKNLIEFLNFLEERQDQLLTATQRLTDQQESAALRRFARETADTQDLLHEEIEPLREKIRADVGGAAAAQQGREDPATVLDTEAVKVGESMQQAVEALQSLEANGAVQNQEQALAGLNGLYLAVASYQKVLQRAIKAQAPFVPPPVEAEENEPIVEPMNDSETDSDNVSDDSVESQDQQPLEIVGTEAVDPLEKRWQPRISTWASVLPLHAEQQLPQLRQQLEELAETSDQPQKPAGSESEDGELSEQEKQAAKRKQLEGLISSMELAVELGPQAVADSQAAQQHLNEDHAAEADIRQAAVLETLRKIAEPLVDQENNDQQDQDNNEENQDGGDQQNQDENKQNQDGEDQNDEENQDNNEDQNRDGDDGTEQEQSEQSRSSQDEQQSAEERQRQAESTLRKAREREEEHRRKMKQLRALLNRGSRVERDW